MPSRLEVVDSVALAAGLLAAVSAKHVLADPVLQSDWMACDEQVASAWPAQC